MADDWTTETEALLAAYDARKYAPDNAAIKLLAEFGAPAAEFVPEFRRDEFREALAYRDGACVNLEASRAIHPSKLLRRQDGKP